MEYEAKLPPRYMEVNKLWDAEKGKTALTNRDRVVAAYKRSFSDRVPVYPIVASFAGTLDGLSIEEYCTNPTRAISAMMNYYERYQPDVVLAYNDLAKEAEAFGCGVKYSDYVVPSIETHAARGQGGSGQALDARSVQDRAAARLPRAVRGPREGGTARGHRRGGGGAVDDRDAAAQPGDDAARHLRGSAVHPRPHAAHHRLLQALGRRDRQDQDRALASPSRPRRSAWSLRTTTASSSRPTTRSWWTTSRPRRSASPPTSAASPTRSSRT